MERDKLSKPAAKLSHSQYNDLNIQPEEQEKPFEGEEEEEDHQIKKKPKLNNHEEKRGRGRPRGSGKKRSVAPIIRSPSVSADDYDDHHKRGRKKKQLMAVVAAAGGSEEGVVRGNVLGNGQLTTRSKRLSGSPQSLDQDNYKKQSHSHEVTDPVSGKLTQQQIATPIPERKLLEIVLDKLQKKDKYEVFAEPVDPEEVPDYYEYIKNPMDFGTIRLKLAEGVYAGLEQFEKDVNLICSNAMSYNASSTIYYRHARAIQELAQKYFQILRLDPEKIQLEHRSPSNSKSSYSAQKFASRTPSGILHFEYAGADLAPAETLAANGNNANLFHTSLHDSAKLKRGDVFERSGTGFEYSNGSGYQGRNNADGNSSAVDNKGDHSEVFSAYALKMRGVKDGRRALLWEEERRDSYRSWNHLANGDESIFAIPGGGSKRLIPTGILSESTYARSLARFSADLGPVAWKIAAQKIKRACSSAVGSFPDSNTDPTATSVNLLSIEKNRIQPKSVSVAVHIDEGENRFNQKFPTQLGSNERLVVKGISEGQSKQSTSTMSSATTKTPTNSDAYRTLANWSFLQNNQSAKINSAREPSNELHFDGTKQIDKRSGDLITASTKFTSEVSQSRLLEIVSRNNKLMQWMPTQQADGGPVMNFQVTDSQSIATDRGGSRERIDTSKLPTSSGSTNVAVPTGNASIYGYQDRSIAISAGRPTSEHFTVKDLNYLNNSDKSKIFLPLQKTNTDIYVGTPQLSISSIGPTVTQEHNTVPSRVRSQNADMAHLDSTSQSMHGTIQNASNSHFNSQQGEPQLRPSSSISQFMQQQMLLDMSSYLQSQVSQMNPQNSTMMALNISDGNTGQIFRSHVSNRMADAKPLGENELLQSHLHPSNVGRSQEHFQKLSDSSHSAPSESNMGFRSPKSPVRQSPEVLVHPQQPDLALQL